MKPKHAAILAFLLTGLIASNIYLFSIINQDETRESVIVARVIDGDTFQLEDGRKIRLTNINAPEKSQANHELSLNYLKQFLNKSIQIEITETDRYGRTLANVYTPDYLNLNLVSLGFASKFLVQDSEISNFAKAEAQAISTGLGIWTHSNHYDCLTSQIDKYEEFVILTNDCQEISFQEWILKDESTKIFKFPEIQFTQLTLHTSKGTNTETDLYWNQNQNRWNNDRDTLYIFDSQGNLAHHNSYGY
ncbi:hypothetical protein CMI47_01315 [Candidatus Pacearchaeota archaeon]|nr:hypothetical protein [Candidatus Pacearchaeota archaeon]